MNIKQMIHSRTGAVVAAAAVLAIAGGGAGYAAATIGSAEVKDNSLQSVDIKDGTLGLVDLSAATRNMLQNGNVIKSIATGQPFTASNPSVTLTSDGVQFGPYTNGGASGGSLCFSGFNGKPLSTVKQLSYTVRYTADNNTGGVGVPYFRIFLGPLDAGGNPTHDAIFSPNTQVPDPDVAEGPFNTYVPTSGSWRYDDDAGENTPSGGLSFAQLLAAHGTEVIQGDVCITTGFSNGTNLSALLRSVEIQGLELKFRG